MGNIANGGMDAGFRQGKASYGKQGSTPGAQEWKKGSAPKRPSGTKQPKK